MRWIVALLLAVAPAQSLSAESIYTSSGDRLSYVLLTDKGGNAMMSGSIEDITRARSLRAGDVPLLYIHEGGVAYVIRDAAILRRAQEIIAPQQELGRRQGELGKQQGGLGRRQGALGAEQGRLGRMMADARVRELSELGRQQGELGRQQATLGEQQAVLGHRQAELGHEQARLAEAARPQLRALVTDAIQRGLAQRVN